MKKLVARELLLMFPAKFLKQIPNCLFVWKPWSTDFRHFQTVFASIEGEPHCPSTALYSYSIIACVERRMGTKLQTVCRIKSQHGDNTEKYQNASKCSGKPLRALFPAGTACVSSSERKNMKNNEKHVNLSIVDKRLNLPQSSEHSWDGRHLSMT